MDSLKTRLLPYSKSIVGCQIQQLIDFYNWSKIFSVELITSWSSKCWNKIRILNSKFRIFFNPKFEILALNLKSLLLRHCGNFYGNVTPPNPKSRSHDWSTSTMQHDLSDVCRQFWTRIDFVYLLRQITKTQIQLTICLQIFKNYKTLISKAFAVTGRIKIASSGCGSCYKEANSTLNSKFRYERA